MMNSELQPHGAGTKPRTIASYPQQHPPISITLGEASRISGLGRSSLYRLIRSGKLRSVVIGDRRLVLYASLQQLLEVPE
jgi:excisionase family DNA binding protein